MLALAISAGIIISAFLIYPKVVSAQKTDKDMKDISSITTGIKQLYHGQPNFSGLSTDIVINSKIAPEHMIKGDTPRPEGRGFTSRDGNKLYLSNAKEITVFQNTSSTQEYLYNYYGITVDSVPDEECVKLLPMIFKQGFILRVNSEQVQRDASSPTVFSISNAVQYCNQKQKGNTITLFMY